MPISFLICKMGVQLGHLLYSCFEDCDHTYKALKNVLSTHHMLHNWHVSPITAAAATAAVKILATQLLQGLQPVLQLRLLWF